MNKKILKLIWSVLIILWMPFEVVYIFFSINDNTFKISNVCIFLSNKLYEINKKK